MQSVNQSDVLGYVELQVGSLAVQVPIRAAKPMPENEVSEPLASFAVEGEDCAIFVRSDTLSTPVRKAMVNAAQEALRHFSRKLLN